MSRYESRLRIRYEKAIKRLDSLIATRQRLPRLVIGHWTPPVPTPW